MFSAAVPSLVLPATVSAVLRHLSGVEASMVGGCLCVRVVLLASSAAMVTMSDAGRIVRPLTSMPRSANRPAYVRPTRPTAGSSEQRAR
jgi:hypothetical protein